MKHHSPNGASESYNYNGLSASEGRNGGNEGVKLTDRLGFKSILLDGHMFKVIKDESAVMLRK